MHDAALMREVERLRKLRGEANRERDGQPRAGQPFAQRAGDAPEHADVLFRQFAPAHRLPLGLRCLPLVQQIEQLVAGLADLGMRR